MHGNYSISYITRQCDIPSSAPFGLTYIVVFQSLNTYTNNDNRRIPFLFLLDLESIFRSQYLGQVVGGNVDDLLTIKSLIDRDIQNLLERANERTENNVLGIAREEIEDVRIVKMDESSLHGEQSDLLGKNDEFNKQACFVKRTLKRTNKRYEWVENKSSNPLTYW